MQRPTHFEQVPLEVVRKIVEGAALKKNRNEKGDYNRIAAPARRKSAGQPSKEKFRIDP